MLGLARRRWVLGLAMVVLACGAAVWFALQESKPKQTDAGPASRIDTQPRACLATTASSNPNDASRAWDGLKAAAKTDNTLVIQRFGAATSSAHTTLLNTLTQMRCTVVVAVGDDLSTAAASLNSPTTHFVAITSAPAHGGQLDDLSEAALSPGQVKAAVLHAIGRH